MLNFLICFCVSETQIKHGCRWLKVFYHDSSTGIYFSSLSDALSCNTSYKFSILGSIDGQYQINGKFEFLLEYPDVEGYNRWKQTLNPKDNPESNGKQATGYEGISISFPGRYWGGLVKSSDPGTVFDGSAGNVNWWFAIGCKSSSWKPKLFPGPAISYTELIPVSKVILWVRNDHLEPIVQETKLFTRVLGSKLITVLSLIINF